MLDPVVTTALGFAFNEFLKSGAGELGKKATGEALTKANEFRKLIWTKFKGDGKAEKALATIEQEGSAAALTKLETYLDDAIEADPVFAQEVRQLAQQITNIQNQGTIDNRQYNNYGRDQINIETIQGNPTIGGS